MVQLPFHHTSRSLLIRSLPLPRHPYHTISGPRAPSAMTHNITSSLGSGWTSIALLLVSPMSSWSQGEPISSGGWKTTPTSRLILWYTALDPRCTQVACIYRAFPLRLEQKSCVMTDEDTLPRREVRRVLWGTHSQDYSRNLPCEVRVVKTQLVHWGQLLWNHIL